MNIYLFSILDNIQIGCGITGAITITASIVITVFYFILRDDCYKKEEIKNLNRKFIKLVPILFIGYIFFMLSMFLPSQDGLIKSYIVIRGKEQITKGNIEKIIKVIDIKSDKIIEVLKK